MRIPRLLLPLLPAALLFAVMGCNPKPSDQRTVTSDSFVADKPVAQPPVEQGPAHKPDTNSSGQPKQQVELAPLPPVPERAGSGWPELDATTTELERVVQGVYQSKGDVKTSDIDAVDRNVAALLASARKSPSRATMVELLDRTLKGTRDLRRRIESERNPPPIMRLELIRSPIILVNDGISSLPEEPAVRNQMQRYTWMMQTLDAVQNYLQSLQHEPPK